MKRTVINLATEKSRGIDALKGTGVPAVFSDAVRIDLGECALLFISGVIGADESGQLVGRTMKEQTRRVLERIQAVRVRVYATQVDQASIRDIHEVRAGFFTAGNYPASTLVRVDQLIRDGALIEIDADAVIPTR